MWKKKFGKCAKFFFYSYALCKIKKQQPEYHSLLEADRTIFGWKYIQPAKNIFRSVCCIRSAIFPSQQMHSNEITASSKELMLAVIVWIVSITFGKRHISRYFNNAISWKFIHCAHRNERAIQPQTSTKMDVFIQWCATINMATSPRIVIIKSENK